jgi:hypothetical protein
LKHELPSEPRKLKGSSTREGQATHAAIREGVATEVETQLLMTKFGMAEKTGLSGLGNQSIRVCQF